MQIKNAEFCLGERYIGEVNQRTFLVVGFKDQGSYTTPSGGVHTQRHPVVCFQDEETGEIWEVNKTCAKYYLLRKIEPTMEQSFRGDGKRYENTQSKNR